MSFQKIAKTSNGASKNGQNFKLSFQNRQNNERGFKKMVKVFNVVSETIKKTLRMLVQLE
jgi:hypothetical protein